MPSLIDEHTQYVDSSGAPLVGGSVYIGAQNQDPEDNSITIYSDRDLTTSIANPQTLDANGRTTNKIWVPGKYSIRVDDSSDAQQYQELDAGELSQTGITTLTNVQGTNTITADGEPTVTSLSNGQTYIFTAANTNTGAVTLQIDTTTAKSIVKQHDQALASGDIEQNQIVQVVYNSTDDTFEMTSHANSGGFTNINATNITATGTITDSVGNVRVQPGYINGLELSNGTDADHDIDIASGECVVGTSYLALSATLTKQLDATWAEGDDAGGLFTGSIAADTWYHVFIIEKDSDGTIDGGYDTSVSAANIPSGWSNPKLLGSVLTDVSSNIIAFSQNNNEILWSVPVESIDSGAPGTSANLWVMDVPIDYKVISIIGVNMIYNSVAGRALITSPDQADSTPAVGLHTLRVSAASDHQNVVMNVRTDTSGRIRYRQDDTNPDVKIFTYGWVYER